MKTKEEKLEYALNRYKCAKRRAVYWSGNPSFSLYRTRESRTNRLSEKYDLAMCDCENWEREIGRLTGKTIPHYDPKKEFAERWHKMA